MMEYDDNNLTMMDGNATIKVIKGKNYFNKLVRND